MVCQLPLLAQSLFKFNLFQWGGEYMFKSPIGISRMSAFYKDWVIPIVLYASFYFFQEKGMVSYCSIISFSSRLSKMKQNALGKR